MTALPWLDLRWISHSQEHVLAHTRHGSGNSFIVDDPAELNALPRGQGQIIYVDPHSRSGNLCQALWFSDGATTGHPGLQLHISHAQELDSLDQLARLHGRLLLDYSAGSIRPLEKTLDALSLHDYQITVCVDTLHTALYLAQKYDGSQIQVTLSSRNTQPFRQWLRLQENSQRPLHLEAFEVTEVRELGIGLHARVDLCSTIHSQEGLMIGSSATRLLQISTLPEPSGRRHLNFAVSAGSAQSFIYADNTRLRHLSRLQSGEQIFAVNAEGRRRQVIVGRVRIERSPLIAIETRSSQGASATLIAHQDPAVCLTSQEGRLLRVTDLMLGERIRGCEPNTGWIDSRAHRGVCTSHLEG